MTREERDYFEQQRHRQFRQSVIGGAVVMMCIGAYWVYMLRGAPERALVVGTGAVALYLVLVSLSVWRLRRPASKWPSRAAMIVSVVPVTILLSSNTPTMIGVLTDVLPILVAVAGGMLIGSSVTRRRGATEFCAACQYEKGDGSGDRCPECGTRWNKPGATIRGERVASIPGVAAGLAALASGLALMWAAWRFRAEVLGIMPRGPLLAHLAYASDTEATEIVARLATMEIPKDDARRAADRILRARASNQFGVATPTAMDWVASKWRAGVLDDAVMERYARESAVLSLRQAGGARATTPVTIEVACVSRFSGTRHKVLVAVESITVDDGRELVGASESGLHSSLIDTPMFPQYAIRGTFTPGTAGSRRATLAYWLFVTDGEQGALSWTEMDGVRVPVLAPSPLGGGGPPIWSGRFTTTLEFTVEP